MAKKDRTIVILACGVCKNRNYHYAIGKKKEKKLEVKKYCSNCDKHTLHKETK
ncbi:MAG: 50S ribosomal protein L33 [Elusimicrobia bacterium]|nr:50S ribosomal protein L33 [Candidatus Liberimonas magnetica]